MSRYLGHCVIFYPVRFASISVITWFCPSALPFVWGWHAVANTLRTFNNSTMSYSSSEVNAMLWSVSNFSGAPWMACQCCSYTLHNSSAVSVFNGTYYWNFVYRSIITKTCWYLLTYVTSADKMSMTTTWLRYFAITSSIGNPEPARLAHVTHASTTFLTLGDMPCH